MAVSRPAGAASGLELAARSGTDPAGRILAEVENAQLRGD